MNDMSDNEKILDTLSTVTRFMKTKNDGSYEPNSRRRFILSIEGIDSWLIKKVWLPNFMDGKTLTVEIYDSVAPSGLHQLVELKNRTLTGEMMKAEFKLLDKVGIVVKHISMRNVQLSNFYFKECFSYQVEDPKDDPAVLIAEFDVEKLKVND